MAEVDVVIPTCGRPAALAVTLTSLIAQTYRDFRTVISDQTEGRPAWAAPEVQTPLRVLKLHGNEAVLSRNLPGAASRSSVSFSSTRCMRP